MGYEYDSQVNRELAKTAMDIYKKAHNFDQPVNESRQNLNEGAIRENVNGLIMNYISDVIILAEAQMGREMTDIEISEASDELLRRIDSISDADKVAFINELSEAAGPGMAAAPVVGANAGGGGNGAVAPPRTTGRDGGMRAVRSNASRAKPNNGLMQRKPSAGESLADVANYYSPAAGFTLDDALAQLFLDNADNALGFSNGQLIAMVLANFQG